MAEPVQKLSHRGSTKGAQKPKKPSAKFTNADYQLLVTWLQQPGNRAKIEGDEGKTNVGGKTIVKSKAFEELALYINENQKKGSTLREVNSKSMKSRWIFYFDKYRRTKEASEATGCGLTDDDLKLGLNTVEDKLESLCPFYSKMEAIFERSVKVKAHADWDSHLSGSEDEEELPACSVVPDSIPPEELLAGLNTEEAGSNATREEVRMPAHGPPQAQHTDVGDGDAHPVNAQDNQSLGPNATAAEDLCDPDSPNVNSDATEPESTPTNQASEGQKRKSSITRTTFASKEKSYPSKKHISENRHSINAAFAENLEAINEHKSKLAELQEKRWTQQTQLEEKRAATDQDRFVWEKQQARLERKDKTAKAALETERFTWEKDAVALDRKDRKIVAAISSTRSVEEITRLLDLFK